MTWPRLGSHPTTTWCLTVTHDQGHAIGHRRARPEPRSGPGLATTHPASPGSPSPRPIGGPPGGYGSWRFTTASGASPPCCAIDPIAIDICDHRFAAAGHDPGVELGYLASPARHADRTHVPMSLGSGGFRAQHPVRPRRPELPVQCGTEVPARASAQARPPLDGRRPTPARSGGPPPRAGSTPRSQLATPYDP